jgi:hypothetical protein
MTAELALSLGQQEPDRIEDPEEQLSAYLDAGRQLVEGGIAAFVSRHYGFDNRVLGIVRYVARGGKRLRGILALLVCEAFGGTAAAALPAAVAVELAHAASLAHDDIIDGDRRRRGRATLHVQYDLATAILVPHLIVPNSVLSAQVYGPRAVQAILAAWARVARGQVRDSLPLPQAAATAMGDGCLAADEYWRIVREKTAALFVAAAELGALAASASQSEVRLSRRYAAWLGCAFQVADDVADLELWAGRGWASVLGEQSPRSLHALRQVVGGEQTIGRATIDQARRLAALQAARSEKCLATWPASPQRELLRALPAYAVQQMYAEADAGHGEAVPTSSA